MFIDANSVDSDALIQADVCIVGSGAAGLSLALELMESDLSVCILEAGNLSDTAESRKLHEFESPHLPVSEESRKRQYGGTTTVWTGRWKPHDPIDFKERSWVPHSGWPISREDVDPYYERAAQRLDAPNLSTFELEFAAPYIQESSHQPFHNDVVQSSLFQFMKEKDWDFGARYKDELARSEAVQVYLNANVTSINQKGGQVESLTVKTLQGNAFQVKAKAYVLATGGIENSRLLLASDVGNEHDQVGRYYMEHPKGLGGRLLPESGDLKLPLYMGFESEIGPSIAGLALSEEVQKKYGILNSYLLLHPIYTWGSRIKSKFGAPLKMHSLRLRNYMEQAPVEWNRVTLSDERDALGIPRARVEWSISEQDKYTMNVFHSILDQEMQRLGFGRVESPLTNGTVKKWPIRNDSSHHMGGTRMGTDPKFSVVDANAKLHSVDNLYVAGSSVFPTSGYANPTATLVALAIRLADHLRDIV